jgi:hypothetical protein
LEYTLPALLSACFVLGLLHGVIPDEHTWPITFSYSVGSTTGRGGMMAGIFFSSAFTLQRAIMSELAYLAIVSVIDLTNYLGYVYIAVGIAMSAAGFLLIRGSMPHWHPLMWISTKDRMRHIREEGKKKVPVHWTIIHGFIAGFGVDTGLFTTFVYLVAVPAMPSPILGFLPGVVFGLGTMFVLAAVGLALGSGVRIAQRFGVERIETFGSLVAARSLFIGGFLFMAAGLFTISPAAGAVSIDIGNTIILSFMILIVVPVILKSWADTSKKPVSSH